jgi:hypothetical protein
VITLQAFIFMMLTLIYVGKITTALIVLGFISLFSFLYLEQSWKTFWPVAMACGLIVGLAHWRIDRHRADGGNLVFSSSARTDERIANQNVHFGRFDR